MSTNCYYFCSQLPYLQFDAPPPFSLKSFDRQVVDIMSEKQAKVVVNAVFPVSEAINAPAIGLYSLYRSWDRALLGEIARSRMVTAETTEVPEEMPEEVGTVPLLNEAVASAASAPNPMERERRVDALRWDKINELAVGRDFTLDALVAYRLKLAILNKHYNYNEEDGQINLKSAIEKIDLSSAE